MFEELGEKLDSAVSKIKGYGTLTEDNIGDVYYNLQGQRIKKPTKGLFLQKGKKVIVR